MKAKVRLALLCLTVLGISAGSGRLLLTSSTLRAEDVS